MTIGPVLWRSSLSLASYRIRQKSERVSALDDIRFAYISQQPLNHLWLTNIAPGEIRGVFCL